MENLPLRRNVPIATALHPAVYAALGFCMLWILAALWGFFARGVYSALQIAVCTVFGAVFMGVPLVLARFRGGTGKHRPFREWLDGEFETAVGPIDARHATAMILTAPAACATGITLMGIVLRLV